jgi:hypothetical protein
MIRRLFTLLSALSLLLCVATAAAWAWSTRVGTLWGWQCRVVEQGTVYDEQYAVFACRGSVGVAGHQYWVEPSPAALTEWLGPRTGLFAEAITAADWPPGRSDSTWGRQGFVDHRVGVPGTVFWQVVVGAPWWGIVAVSAVAPAAALARARRTRRRNPLGLCPACGYDLRATPGRCPECGSVPAVKGAA